MRGVGCSSAGGISVSREGVGGGRVSDPCPRAQDVLMSNSSSEVEVRADFPHASNNSLLVGLAVQNAALARKLQLKQPKSDAESAKTINRRVWFVGKVGCG